MMTHTTHKKATTAAGPRMTSTEPCPVCGVATRAHWTCRRCTARGHITGRATSDPTLCSWCEDELEQRSELPPERTGRTHAVGSTTT